MRILILGTNYSAKKFLEVFSKNKDNDVFSMFSFAKNYIDFVQNADIVDFCVANDINLVLTTEEKFITSYLTEELSENNITVFAPTVEAIEISSSKAFAKRFMYKNQISTPKFFVAEKLQTALEYIKTSNFPIAIKPDNHSFQEGTLFCQTKKDAIQTIEKFFDTGNKKIILEDYVEGKNISVWILCDGYRTKIININAKYQNNIAFSKENLINEELKNKIEQQIIYPTIQSLVNDGREYVGILGFDIITKNNQDVSLVGYNSFFDDISVDFFAENENYNFEEIFISTVVGNIFMKDILPKNTDFMLTYRKNEEINFVCAKTKSNLLKILDETDIDFKELEEAKKVWKM